MSSSRAPVPEKRFSYESLSDVRGAGVIGTGIRSVNLAPHPFKDHEIGVKTGVGLASLQVGEARDLIRDALERQPAAVRTLVDRLSPVIERKVAATLWRRVPRSVGSDYPAIWDGDLFRKPCSLNCCSFDPDAAFSLIM